MKKNYRSVFVLALIILAFIIFIEIPFVGGFVGMKLKQNFSLQVQEIVLKEDQQKAIMELIELRGKVIEIERLYIMNVNDNILMHEIRNLTSFQNLTNPYLKDLRFVIQASSVGAICEEIVSQIDSQIDLINSVTEDA